MDTRDAGKMGGASKSPAKQAASRRNGAKGGRPRVSAEYAEAAAQVLAAGAAAAYADGDMSATDEAGHDAIARQVQDNARANLEIE